ncbi:N-acetyl-gamma-glutamyl-phosphate reductase [Candidatus Dojkabacteria bacterium]|nr:N-acetyl-gamma-glutamyl-phosphate reductase [Candidatus Dojkabacteria bacterium]
MNNKITVSIVGGSGYAGGELLRILLNHPDIEIGQVTSRKLARFPVDISHPNLGKRTKLKFSRVEDLEECDLLFLAMPNGESQKNIEQFMDLAPRIIDLGADYRINDLKTYEQWYGEHQMPEFLEKFVYGIAELHREEIRNAKYVSTGGCEATCSILTLYPLFKNDLIDPKRTVIDAKLGSSAAGAKVTPSSHHPERAGVVRSYKPTMHRHTAEIEQEMSLVSSSKEPIKVHISATAIEMVRGILVTCHAFLRNEFKNLSERDLWKIYHDTYREETFVRLVNSKMGNFRFPEPKLLEGTNFCDIGLQKDQRSNRVVAIGAIDNLVKGTAGQAVQAMNLMYGFDEATGLEFTGLHPI